MLKKIKKINKKPLRIYLILADENLFHPYYLSGLISKFKKEGHTIVGITLALDIYKKGFAHAVMQQIKLWGFLPFLFIGGNAFARSFFYTLGIANNTIRAVAKENRIPVITSYNVNNKEHLQSLKKLQIDIIISSNGHIFKNELLSLPKIACINRHSALLPKFGGVLPVFWAMLCNENKFGVSVHYMVEKIDKGDILSQEEIVLNKNNSLFYNYILAFDKSIKATVDAINNIFEGKIVKKFTHNKNEYYSFPSDEEISQFKEKYRTFALGDIVEFYKLSGK